MIPILYEHDETSFTTNGICRLPDCIRCQVTEVVNGAYECEFKYPVTGRHYEDITEGRIIYTTHDDSRIPQPFDIYRHTVPIDGVVTFYARHISYRLSFVVVEPYAAGSCTMAFAQIPLKSINANPFTFLTTVSKTADFEPGYPASARALIGGIQKSIIETYGGEMEWDKFTVRHTPRRGNDTSIELRYGKNITDINYTLDTGSDYTAVVPYWMSNDGDLIAMLPDKIVIREGAGSERTIALDVSRGYDDIPENEDLLAEAQKALVLTPDINIKVKFYELWNTEEYEKYAALQRAYLGDTVTVIYTEYGITDTQRVVKTVYDSLLDRYDSMELGQVKQSFGTELKAQIEDAVVEFAPSKSAMQAAIDHATELIKGGLGGHVIINTNADGQPNEILVMDTDNIETAVNVMRINVNGIGFSHTGYEGPFVSAWTLDSHFVADFITTGNLNAALLTAGVIMGANGHNWFDLENDQVHLGLDWFVLEDSSGQSMPFSDAVLDGLSQDDVLDILIGGTSQTRKGLYLINGELYINWTYARGGTLKLGGLDNVYGLFEVRDASDNLIARIGKDGAQFCSTTGFTGEHIDIDENIIKGYVNQTQYSMIDMCANVGQGIRFVINANGNCDALVLSATNKPIYIDSGSGDIYIASSSGAVDIASGPAGTNIHSGGSVNISAGNNTSTGGNVSMNATTGDMSASCSRNMSLTSNGYLDISAGNNGRIRPSSKFTYTAFESLSSDNPPLGPSDRRLKKNIRDTGPQTDNLMKLKVRSFDWRSIGVHVPAGFIAQEMRDVYPDLVKEGKDGYLMLSQVGLIPYMVKTIQEQQEEIEGLKAEINNIKAILKQGGAYGSKQHN